MGQVAYKKKIRVSVDGETDWKTVPATSPSLDFTGDVLDQTDLKNINADGYRSRLLGLHDWSVNCDSMYTSGDDALVMIRAAKMGRSALFVQYLPDGDVAGGFQGPVVVESYNLSGDLGSLETVSITLQANGPLVVAR